MKTTSPRTRAETPKRKILTVEELKWRRQIVETLAPEFVHEFFCAGDTWTGHEDLACSLWNMADAIVRGEPKP